MKAGKKKSSITLIAVSLVGIIIFLAGILISLIGVGQGEAYYASLPTPVVWTKEPELELIVGSPTEEGAEESARPEAAAEAAEEDDWKPALDFEALSSKCPGIVAWVRIENTAVDYPVMQGQDNDFYLSHLPNGKGAQRGSIFLDYHNMPDFSDRNTLIYGHNMKSGSMFGSLKKYETASYYQDHPTVLIFTPKKNIEVELFAGYLINASEEIPPILFWDDNAFESYIKDIKERSIFDSDVTVSADDRLVSLCTCSYDVRDGRLILVGKLIEK